MTEPVVPKLFLSYSWTTPEHETWVEQLAGRLNDNGVHVIFDKWDLKEGQESTAFMEQMVTDPSVTKVLMLCDKKYAERADKREGGAGTEAQIISSKIYNQANNSKFVAAIRERDEHGKAYVPAYYASRIYIDLSDDASYPTEFDRLLRWIFNKPLNTRPPLGAKPAFLDETREKIRLGTDMELRRAVDALKADKNTANAAVSDYLTRLSEGLEQFRIPQSPEPFDEAVVQSIENFIPYRNEAIELFRTLARYRPDGNSQRALHRFFEKLLDYNSVPEDVNSYRATDFDNFKFITHELLLYAAASFIAEEQFDFLDGLLSTPYYLPKRSDRGKEPTVGFDAFWESVQSLETRNRRLGLNQTSIHADMLKARAGGSGFQFRELMQADFSLYMRNIFTVSDQYRHWYPVTLLYTAEYPSTFEIYARAKSEKFWQKMRPLLANVELSDVRELCSLIEKGQVVVPKWHWHSLQVKVLFGIDKAATIA